jgi:glutamate/tyrosine decarboxylase-like PLP-dependent enzyme
MTTHAEYYLRDPNAIREPLDWTPDHSRRARGTALYAALRQLGRQGAVALVEQSCALAQRFAEDIAQIPSCEVLNRVVLNQVLFRFGDDTMTNAVLAHVQSSGEAWMSGTSWEGRTAIRLSVSSWRTTHDDIARTVAAFETAISSVTD